MKKNINKFYFQVFTPFLVLIILYVCFDPFLMIKKYSGYYESGKAAYVDRNNDYVSTSTYDLQRDKYKYDSFIFGNSRSRYYRVKDWKKYLDSNANCYHFDASNETLYGILKKIEYVDCYSKIKNVIFIFDKEILTVTKPQTTSYLFYLSPQLVGYSNAFGFYTSGFKTFVNPKFFISYIDLMLFGEIRGYMRDFNVFNENIRNYDQQSNETSWPMKEKMSEIEYYTQVRMQQFYERDKKLNVEDDCIYEEQRSQLNKIAEILKKHNSTYRIIISPKYDQKVISRSDLSTLKEIFGFNNVFDFSGKNKFTESYTNYWDVNHYKAEVASEIMKSIY